MNRPNAFAMSLTVAVAALAVAATAMPAAAVERLATICPIDLMLDDGECATPVPQNQLTDFQLDQQAAKDAAVAETYQSLTEAASSQSLATTAAVAAKNYVLPEVANMTIWREGEGNGKKTYTCGPAATRNVVGAMYDSYYQYYKDFGEHQFEIWEGTTTAGTARANVATALNNNFPGWGSWRTYRPTDKTAYLSQVIVNVGYHQSVIANVDTEEYSFWNHHALNHFDFVYGYDNTGSTKYLYVAEEFDVAFSYGHELGYGNPYGRHKEVLSKAYQAVIKTSYHGIVA